MKLHNFIHHANYSNFTNCIGYIVYHIVFVLNIYQTERVTGFVCLYVIVLNVIYYIA